MENGMKITLRLHPGDIPQNEWILEEVKTFLYSLGVPVRWQDVPEAEYAIEIAVEGMMSIFGLDVQIPPVLSQSAEWTVRIIEYDSGYIFEINDVPMVLYEGYGLGNAVTDDALRSILGLYLGNVRGPEPCPKIAHLGQLQGLGITYWEMFDEIEGLSRLEDLRSFVFYGDVEDSEIEPRNWDGAITGGCPRNLSALSVFPKLKSITLDGCGLLKDVSALSGLKNLAKLRLTDCSSLVDLTPLSGLCNLTRLDLSGCISLTDLRPLANLKNLTYVSLCECEALHSLDGLEALKNLKELHLDGCRTLHNVNALASTKALECLSLDKCNMLGDITPIYGLENLLRVNRDGCESIDEIACAMDFRAFV